MADLHALIRLHKYEVDEKRREMSQLYEELAALNQQRLSKITEQITEQENASQSADVHFTMAGYLQKSKLEIEAIEQAMEAKEEEIEGAKETLMESFAELKKYEMTQAEREALEEHERKVKEMNELDEIALETYRRKE